MEKLTNKEQKALVKAAEDVLDAYDYTNKGKNTNTLKYK